PPEIARHDGPAPERVDADEEDPLVLRVAELLGRECAPDPLDPSDEGVRFPLAGEVLGAERHGPPQEAPEDQLAAFVDRQPGGLVLGIAEEAAPDPDAQ